MSREEFKKYFDLFPKGNLDHAYIAAQFEHYSNDADYNLMMSKWQEYLEVCQKEKRDEAYILSLEKFLNKKEYESNFKVTLQLGFLNKYKKK
jgi:hypothetical protein